MQGEFVEEFALKSHAQAAVFEALFVLAVAAINPVLLGVIPAKEPELLHDGVVLTLVDAPEIFELLAERDWGCRGERVVDSPRVKGRSQAWRMESNKNQRDGGANNEGDRRGCHVGKKWQEGLSYCARPPFVTKSSQSQPANPQSKNNARLW
jgi:hypothetical protein